jgi:hypothetical protein
MVVIAIFGMIAGVVLFNFKDFTGGVNLQKLHHERVLSDNFSEFPKQRKLYHIYQACSFSIMSTN